MSMHEQFEADKTDAIKKMRKKIGNRPLLAIRENCLECCGSWKEVQKCSIEACPLHAFRFGIRPDTLNKKGNR